MDNYAKKMLKSGKDMDEVCSIKSEKYYDLVDRIKKEPPAIKTPTGLKKLDDIIGGFEGGRLYVLSAPTKNGKTTLAQTLMFNQALAGFGSIFFSFEMGWKEVTKKFQKMEELVKSQVELPLFIPIDIHRESGDLQLDWIVDSIIKCKKQNPTLSLVVIDHLHFLLPLSELKNTSFVIGGIVRKLKRIAVSLEISILLISHVKKISDDKVPTFNDIRDSSFITQEADVTMMMWRLKSKEAAKRIDDDNDENIYTNRAFLSVELNRDGDTGKFKLVHNGVMFEEYNEKTHGYVTEKIDNIKTTIPLW